MMNKISWKILLTLLMCAASLVAHAASTRTITFDNNTGRMANDLHVEFNQAVKLSPRGGPFGAFSSESGSGTSKVDFRGGQVANGNSTRITFVSGSPQITIRRWWWTFNGRRIGRVMGEIGFATVAFNQDALRLGETATIALQASGYADQKAEYRLEYRLLFPNGESLNIDPINVAVGAGKTTHEQLWSAPLNQQGVYRLEFKTIDKQSGLVLSEGGSELLVDDGEGEMPKPQ